MMSDLLRPTGMSLPRIAEGLRNGGLTTAEIFEAADVVDEATAEIRRLRNEVARLTPRGGWGFRW
jgi:hypothetical protein